jgi:methyl-accepting chemotaxis protein
MKTAQGLFDLTSDRDDIARLEEVATIMSQSLGEAQLGLVDAVEVLREHLGVVTLSFNAANQLREMTDDTLDGLAALNRTLAEIDGDQPNSAEAVSVIASRYRQIMAPMSQLSTACQAIELNLSLSATGLHAMKSQVAALAERFKHAAEKATILARLDRRIID